MPSESRDSYLAALAQLEAYATGAGPGPSVPPDARGAAAALAKVGDELLAVAGLLESQPRLRRLLADPGRPGPDRAALLDSLIATRVSGPAAGFVRTLVSGHWASPAELLDAAERLGVEALFASGAATRELGEVEDELYRFGQIIGSSTQLSTAIGSRTTPVAQRLVLARDLLDGRARPLTIRLVEVALHGFGGRNVAASLTRLVELAALRRDRQVAYVTVAWPLRAEQEDRLTAALSRISGRQVEIKFAVAPAILGGVRVQLGHDLYDGTVARRLDDTRALLT